MNQQILKLYFFSMGTIKKFMMFLLLSASVFQYGFTVSFDTTLVDNLVISGTISGASSVIVGNGTDLSITGSIYSLGTITLGNTQIIGESTSISSIDNFAPTDVLTLEFSDFAGATPPLKKGARVTLYCDVAGTISSVDSVNYYKGDLIISPGATGGDNCTLVVVDEDTKVAVGSPTVLTSGISGVGTTAVISLISSVAMTDQAVTIFYEVRSNNLLSVS